MRKYLLHPVLALVAVAGCSSTTSPGSIGGTIRGNSYPVAASASAILTSAATNATSNAVIVLSSSDDVCESAGARVQHPGEKTVVILLFDGNAAPSKPGTFPIVDPASSETPAVRAIFYTSILDATCGNNAADQTTALSGSVTLTVVGGGVFHGNFDVTLDSGDHITGSFNPSLCEDLPAAFKDPGTPTCTP